MKEKQKKKTWNKKRHFQRKNILQQSIAVFLICAILIGLLPATAQAATLKIKYNGQKVDYTGAQTKISIDSKSINLKETPGIILNNTNMVSYYDVFRTGLGATTSYDSSTKKLIISFYDITVEMTVGSKTAYVNGKKKTLDVAPMSVHFYSIGKTKIFVPAGSVAQALGCGYVWDNSTRTGKITSPYLIKLDGKWTIYTGTKGKATYNDKKINIDKVPSIIKDSTALLSAAKVFKTGLGAEYIYDSSTKQISISQNDVQIIMKVGSKEATVNGIKHTLTTAPRSIKYKSTGKSYIMVPGEFVATNLGYSYKWNASTGTSMITKKNDIFFQHSWDGDAIGVATETNMLQTLKVQSNNMTDQIVMNTKFAISPVITQDIANSCIYVDIPEVYSGMEALTEIISKGSYITGITLTPGDSSIRLTITTKANCSYYTMETDTTTTLVICDSTNADTSYQIKVPMPDGVSFKSITTKDYYESNYFTIVIPGDWRSYFESNPIVFNSETIASLEYDLNASGNTVIRVDTYELQGFKLKEENGFIGVNVGNPSDIYQNIVVLDAGHGGTDPGAISNSTNEKDLTFAIIYELAEKYFNSPDSPVKAYWTRKTDVKIELSDRAAFAEKVEADFFISLHMNSSTSKTAKGMEVLYTIKNNSSTLGGANSKTIAKEYADYLISTLGMTGRSNTTVERPNLVVLKKNTVPAILIELGFISNSSDYKKIIDEKFQEKTAKAIYNATVDMFENHPTGR